MDDGSRARLHRLARHAQRRARAVEGRHPLPPGRHPRRGQGARDVDDVEVRADEPPVRRREGRCRLDPKPLSPGRARADDPPLHVRDRQRDRPRARHPGAGRRHDAAGDGLDLRHVLDEPGPLRALASSPASRSRSAARSGRQEATGRGVVFACIEAVRRRGPELDGLEVAVQGFGNVGTAFARMAAEAGAKVVAISDTSGGIYNPSGLDVAAACAQARAAARSPSSTTASAITNEELLAARLRRARPVRARAGADRRATPTASGPGSCSRARTARPRRPPTRSSSEGRARVPDVLANAGGVVVSYFEWVQGLQEYFWTEEQVNERLHRSSRARSTRPGRSTRRGRLAADGGVRPRDQSRRRGEHHPRPLPLVTARNRTRGWGPRTRRIGRLARHQGNQPCSARVDHAAWCIPSPRARHSGINHLVTTLTLYVGRDCHLCEIARAELAALGTSSGSRSTRSTSRASRARAALPRVAAGGRARRASGSRSTGSRSRSCGGRLAGRVLGPFGHNARPCWDPPSTRAARRATASASASPPASRGTSRC